MDRKKQRNYKTRCLCIAIVFYIETFWAWDAAKDVNTRMVVLYVYSLHRLCIGSDEASALKQGRQYLYLSHLSLNFDSETRKIVAKADLVIFMDINEFYRSLNIAEYRFSCSV